MRWLAALAMTVACCSGPAKPTTTTTTKPASSGSAACSCAAACDCYGVDDPERHAARAKAAEQCRAAGVTCNCGECLAP